MRERHLQGAAPAGPGAPTSLHELDAEAIEAERLAGRSQPGVRKGTGG